MKTPINIDSKLADIILTEPSVVTVLNKFGISLGVSDKTIAQVCAEHHLDRDFLVTIINTYVNEEYFPERMLSSFSAGKIIEYLRMTNTYYSQYQIPNIERHFQFLIQKSDAGNNNLGLIMRFFKEVKNELLSRIADDEERWFPEVAAMERQTGATDDMAIEQWDEETDTIEDKFDDLVSMFVIHLAGDFDNNLAYAVLLALISMKKDIRQNNRIRNRILRPLAMSMTRQLKSQS